MLNTQDFRFLWQGKHVKPLLPEQAGMLDPIDIRGKGRERALLLLHGFSSSPAVFRAMLPDLAMYDAVVCPVLPGHAESIAAFGKVKAADWISAAEVACSALFQAYDAVDVMGLSLGGILACHLSKQFNLHRLYLLAPALSLHMNVPLVLSGARLLHRLGFKLLRSRGGNIYTSGYPELTYRQLPIATIIEMLTLIRNYTFEPPQCPTDLFLGRFDQLVNSPRVAELFSASPNVTIHWLENSAHVLPLDGDIATIVACIKSHQRL